MRNKVYGSLTGELTIEDIYMPNEISSIPLNDPEYDKLLEFFGVKKSEFPTLDTVSMLRES